MLWGDTSSTNCYFIGEYYGLGKDDELSFRGGIEIVPTTTDTLKQFFKTGENWTILKLEYKELWLQIPYGDNTYELHLANQSKY